MPENKPEISESQTLQQFEVARLEKNPTNSSQINTAIKGQEADFRELSNLRIKLQELIDDHSSELGTKIMTREKIREVRKGMKANASLATGALQGRLERGEVSQEKVPQLDKVNPEIMAPLQLHAEVENLLRQDYRWMPKALREKAIDLFFKSISQPGESSEKKLKPYLDRVHEKQLKEARFTKLVSGIQPQNEKPDKGIYSSPYEMIACNKAEILRRAFRGKTDINVDDLAEWYGQDPYGQFFRVFEELAMHKMGQEGTMQEVSVGKVSRLNTLRKGGLKATPDNTPLENNVIEKEVEWPDQEIIIAIDGAINLKFTPRHQVITLTRPDLEQITTLPENDFFKGSTTIQLYLDENKGLRIMNDVDVDLPVSAEWRKTLNLAATTLTQLVVRLDTEDLEPNDVQEAGKNIRSLIQDYRE